MATTPTLLGLLTFVILLQTAEVQMWWTSTSTTPAYSSGSCSYQSYNYYYSVYRTKYKYCSYQCCGSFYYRYCCYNYSSYYYTYYYYVYDSISGAAIAGIVIGCLVAGGIFISILICACMACRKRQGSQGVVYQTNQAGVTVATVQSGVSSVPATGYPYPYPVAAPQPGGVNAYPQPPPVQQAPGAMPPYQPGMAPPYQPPSTAGGVTNTAFASGPSETKSSAPPPPYGEVNSQYETSVGVRQENVYEELR